MADDNVGAAGYPHGDPDIGEEPDNDARTWGMLCHLAGFAGYVMPFANIFAPLVIWQLKKDQYEFVDVHGKESVNFQLTVTIAVFVSFLLLFILIGFVVLPAVLLFDVVMKVIAAVKASNGECFRYPLSIRFIS